MIFLFKQLSLTLYYCQKSESTPNFVYFKQIIGVLAYAHKKNNLIDTVQFIYKKGVLCSLKARGIPAVRGRGRIVKS